VIYQNDQVFDDERNELQNVPDFPECIAWPFLIGGCEPSIIKKKKNNSDLLIDQKYLFVASSI